MKFALPKIYPITDTLISGLSHLDQVRLLHDGGASMVQLRGKTEMPLEFHNSASEAVAYARAVGMRIIINDRADIALAVGADGVHLGQDDLSPVAARKLLGEKAVIGFSTHSVAQARQALELPIDYIAIGPVFPTSTKANHEPVVGLDGLRSVRQLVGAFPLVAIGGINRKNAVLVLEAGADCVALISELLSEPHQIREKMLGLTQALL